MTTLPRGRSLTLADPEALPDDGWRHELVDGALVMTPAPGWPHQSAVVRRDSITDAGVVGAPLLAVEVLSPSTRHIDLGLKRARYATAGCPSYWVVDPGSDDRAPSIRTWTLTDGEYADAGAAGDLEPLEVTAPYPLRVVPAELLT